MKTPLIALALAAGLAAPAFAQTGNGQVNPPQNNVPNRGAPQSAPIPGGGAGSVVPGQTTQSGQPLTVSQFMMEAMQSDAFETQSSRLAIERGQSEAIRSFAQKMIGDHAKASAAMMQMRGETTASTGAAQQPAAKPLDPRRTDMLRELQASQGAAFDRRYAEQQVMAHQEAVTLFSAYAQNGTDQNLRAFARETLPTLQQHLRDAQAIASRLR
jgi:putative membrane protein